VKDPCPDGDGLCPGCISVNILGETLYCSSQCLTTGGS
jgi:hypothetical protein